MHGTTLRIGVIADTHDCLPDSVLQALRGVDELWHLGDVTALDIQSSLYTLEVPIYLVRGNCDFNNDWPLILDLERNGVHCRLQHIPPERNFPEGVDILLHGHTHVPRDEMLYGIRFLNPGTIGKPNKGALPSFAFLTITADAKVTWDLRLI